MRKIFIAVGLILGLLLLTSIQSLAQQIHACVSKKDGKLQIVADTSECDLKKKKPISWNIEGPPGQAGQDGLPGQDGFHCWDLNENRTCDKASEDINKDDKCDTLDCSATLPVEVGADCGKNVGPGADLRNCDLSNVNFPHFDAKGSDLSGANLTNAYILTIFHNSNLTRANLSGAYVPYLQNCDLRYANLQGARLSMLGNSDLRYANLWGADLFATDLTGANLTGANLNNINWNSVTCPDGTSSDGDDGDGFTCLSNLALP